MFRTDIIAMGAMLAIGVPAVAQAQNSTELDQIRKEIDELKNAYEARIQALEKRLQAAEAAAAKAQTAADQAQSAQQAAVAAPAPVEAAPATASGGLSNAVNPALSLILAGRYADYSQDPSTRSITGFLSKADTSDALGPRGFSLGESELTVSANVDHLFFAQATFGVTPEDTIGVEEAYGLTTALGHGLTIKGGRFFSAIGYQNSVHAHAWDFVDPSLVQRVFLGENYGDDGVQLNWVAPLPVFVEIGGEIGRGSNPPGTDRNKNGIGAGTVFAHVGDDIGTGGSYRFGASMLRTSTDSSGATLGELDDLSGGANQFNGDTQIYGVDFVYKWAPNGNPKYRNFKFVTEWFHRRRSGELNFEPFSQQQSGWYVQGIYQFLPEWRVGLRYDQLDQGSWDVGPLAAASGIAKPDFTPRRYSTMLDWNPSEFSRLRLQYNQDKSQLGLTDHQFFLQYIYSLGAHGAHKF